MHRLLICILLGSMLSAYYPLSGPSKPRTRPVPRPLLTDRSSELPTPEEMVRLATDDPIAFLEACIDRYQREVKGYTCILQKQERIQGRLNPVEEMDITFRERPFSVLLHWRKGARLAEATLYQAGENKDMLLVRPYGKLARALAGEVVTRKPDGPEAKQSGRYPLPEFGLLRGTIRTLDSWKLARDDDALTVEYLGEQPVDALGGRRCHVLKRTGYRMPEADGVTELTIFVDAETWLQTGSILKGPDGGLVAEYYFRDVKLNPTYNLDSFSKSALAR